MDIDNIEEKIKKIESSHTVTRWLIGICIVCVVIFATAYFSSDRYDNSEEKYVKRLQDSLKAHDKQYAPVIDSLQKVTVSSDARITLLEEGLSNTNTQLQEVKNKYDKIRNNITHGSLDDKRKFLSGRLPQSTSTGK